MLASLFGSDKNKLAEMYTERSKKAEAAKTEFGKKVATFHETASAFSVPVSNKEFYNIILNNLPNESKMPEIQKYLTKFHGKMAEQLVGKNAAKYDNNAGIYQLILDDTKSKTSIDDLKARNPGMHEEVEKVLKVMETKMTALFTNYRFFEYKYIQTNVMLFQYVKSIREIFTDYANYSSSLMQAQVIQNMQNTKDIIEKVTNLAKVTGEQDSDPKKIINEIQNMVSTQMSSSSLQMETVLKAALEMQEKLDNMLKAMKDSTILQDGQVQRALNAAASDAKKT